MLILGSYVLASLQNSLSVVLSVINFCSVSVGLTTSEPIPSCFLNSE
jgi:hypothetical protein